MRTKALVAAALVLGATATSADAADPGRWTETGLSEIPLEYYQGVAADPLRNLYFDGIHVGLYRTDSELRETGRNVDVIPLAVSAPPPAGEGDNHLGDIDWDAREGGRILLPLESYVPGGPNNGNPSMTGSIGVADPQTLQWRYYVKLDPAEIPKAMFNVVSPDGQLIWTSSGDDLLAYRTADVNPANAEEPGPGGAAPIKAVRRLPNAVPPSGITGAAFHRGRMYVAGQGTGPFQIWSIDMANGSHRLEIEKEIVGEAEGLVTADVLGGTLHWIITPFNTEQRPTYGEDHNVLLHFVERGSPEARLRLRVTPRRTRAGRRTRLRFVVTHAVGGERLPVEGALVRVEGRRARTSDAGAATMRVRFRRPGRAIARATKGGFTAATAAIRVRSAARGPGSFVGRSAR